MLNLVSLLLVLCSLAACGQKQYRGQGTVTEKMPAGIIGAVIDSKTGLPELKQITAGDVEFDTYLSNYYLREREQVSDDALCCADVVEGSGIAVLVLTDGADHGAVEETFSDYIENRAGDFEGYAPLQAALVKNGTVAVNGKYMALLICPGTSAAKAVFMDYLVEAESLNEPSEVSAGAASGRTKAAEPGDAAGPGYTVGSGTWQSRIQRRMKQRSPHTIPRPKP